MSASIITTKGSSTEKGKRAPTLRWPGIVMWSVLAVLLVLAIWMRSIGLSLPFDRDGYDEGVYWQSLMAMRAGYALYGQIFYSQPPFFLLSTYPLYILLGGSLWSARLSIALVSLVGLPGAFLLGKALKGRLGAVLATMLVVADPLYLSLSQKIEAEVSSAAFSLLAVGAAYLWWESSEGTVSLVLAVLCGIALPLGILCKLLSLTSLVP
nr:glycosyltransferase family 39 protein [Ktedonobacteraceae bacterium]